MELIKYIEDNQEKDIFLPQNFENLFKHFKDSQIITLSNDNDVEWLESFYGKEVNIFELQKVLNVINDIGYYDFKLFKSIIAYEKPESLNEIIKSINLKDNYVLISEFEVFYDDVKLAKNIYYHQDKSNLPNQENIDWKVYGKTIRSKHAHHQTKYGWLFELKPKELRLNPNEIHQVIYPYERYEFKVKLENENKFTYLNLPLGGDKLLNELTILSSNENCNFKFIENKNNDNSKFYNHLKSIIENSHLIDVNEFASKMQNLSVHELNTLKAILEIVPTDDIGEITYLIDSLSSFELISEQDYSPKEHVKEKLQKLFISNTDEFYDILDQFFDYNKYHQELQNKETMVETSKGILKINENFELFPNQDQVIGQ